MRHYPTDESDWKEANRLEPEPWMLELLKLNPSYLGWGPNEDYMWVDGESWTSAVFKDSWQDFGPWQLDDYNEIVNFYFHVTRPSVHCGMCGGNGTHPHAQWISESWYEHSSPFTKPASGERMTKTFLEQFGCRFNDSVVGRGALPPDEIVALYGKPFLDHCVRTMEIGGYWCYDITQDEADALWIHGRMKFDFKELPTAEQVNNWARTARGLGGHDSINRWICVKQRCERLGVPYNCPQCDGRGHLFTGPAEAHVVLWVLHPRKGASRGVDVKIDRSNVPDVLRLLKQADERNRERFAKACDMAEVMV